MILSPKEKLNKFLLVMMRKNKILFGLMLLALYIVIVVDLTTFLLYPKINMEWMSLEKLFGVYFAYFTTQANWMFIGFLTFVFIRKILLKKDINFYVELAFVMYITVTLVVFWVGVLTKIDIVKKYRWFNWIISIILHGVTTTIGVMYFWKSIGKVKVSYIGFLKKPFILIMIWPLFWIVSNMIRGEILTNVFDDQWFMEHFVMENKQWYTTIGTQYNNINEVIENNVVDISELNEFNSEIDYITWYPYYFMEFIYYNFSDIYGNIYFVSTEIGFKIFVFIACLTSIIILIIGLQFLYIFWNNTIFSKKNKNIEKTL